MKSHYNSMWAIILLFASLFLHTGCSSTVSVSESGQEIEALSNEVIIERDVLDDNLVATISLENCRPYTTAPLVTTDFADPADVAEVLVSHTCDNGIEVIFYRAQSGDIYGAYWLNANTLAKFTQGYWAADNSGYQTGYEIEGYQNVLGHDGFYTTCNRGAAYRSYEYYYFKPEGILHLLVECTYPHMAGDWNGDGQLELLYAYHNGRELSYCFERQGKVYIAYLNDLLAQTLPTWNLAQVADSFLEGDFNGGALEVFYWLDDEGVSVMHEAILTFSSDIVNVYCKD